MNLLSPSSWVLCLILQLVAIRLGSATTILVLKTSSEIVAGADSMGAYMTGAKRISNQFCKIHSIHDFFIASAGLYDTRAGQKLNIKELVMRVAGKGDSLSVAAKRSSDVIASALSETLSDARDNDGLDNVLARGNVVTFFFGFERGRPAAYVYRFSATKPEHSKAAFIDSSHEGCGPQCAPAEQDPYLIHTRSQAMEDFRSKNPALLRNDPAAFVRSMILFDIAANKDRSGPPVDILRVDPNGPRWIDKKSNCP
jgi:hypothetical protein